MKKKIFRKDNKGRNRYDRLLHFAGDVLIGDRENRTTDTIKKDWRKYETRKKKKLDKTISTAERDIQNLLEAYRVD